MIELSDKDVLLLFLLEGMLHEEYLNLPKAPTKVNEELYRFNLGIHSMGLYQYLCQNSYLGSI